MSAVCSQEVSLSPEEYIQGELRSELRHEYLAGKVYAMAGASEAHNYIAGNIFGMLFVHLRGKTCAPFTADMKVHIHDGGEDWFYYPDVMVNCSPSGQHKYYCDTPSVIVEVLSPDTEQTDRREKRLAYERIKSLHTYILVAQDKREVTVFHRIDGGWEKTILTGTAETLRIPELEFTLTLDDIYARTGL
jgi:Uma2 family endonuclease